MKSKWIIDIPCLEKFRFGEDKKLYRLPYVKNKRNYGIREIKLQYPSRWILNGVPYSKRQLEGKVIRDPNPVVLFYKENDMPF